MDYTEICSMANYQMQSNMLEDSARNTNKYKDRLNVNFKSCNLDRKKWEIGKKGSFSIGFL